MSPVLEGRSLLYSLDLSLWFRSVGYFRFLRRFFAGAVVAAGAVAGAAAEAGLLEQKKWSSNTQVDITLQTVDGPADA